MEIASLVRNLGIVQFHDPNFTGNYFFGDRNRDWAKVIIAMFSRKMDKLKIYNNQHKQYLPLQSAEMLRHVLFSSILLIIIIN